MPQAAAIVPPCDSLEEPQLRETASILLGRAMHASVLMFLVVTSMVTLHALDVNNVISITIEVGTPILRASSKVEPEPLQTHNQSVQIAAQQHWMGSSANPRPNATQHLIADSTRSVQQTTSDSRLTRLLSAMTESHNTDEQVVADSIDQQPITRPAIMQVSASPTLLVWSVLSCIIIAVLCMMQAPQGGGQRNNRMGGKVPDPPSYDPAHERTFPFRHFTQRLMLWAILAADIDEGQQCAMICNALKGDAALLAGNLSYIDITQGGLVNGLHRGPVEYLLHQLASTFAPLGEEARMQAMTELMSFHANRNESIDSVISRFRIIRWRGAQGNAGIQMTWEGYAWIFLRAIGVNGMQLVQILQPFQGQFPTTEPQMEDMFLTLRRQGHIMENSPNNLAHALRGHGQNFFQEQPNMAFPVAQQPDPWSGGTDPWGGQFPVQTGSSSSMQAAPPANQQPAGNAWGQWNAQRPTAFASQPTYQQPTQQQNADWNDHWNSQRDPSMTFGAQQEVGAEDLSGTDSHTESSYGEPINYNTPDFAGLTEKQIG